MHGLSNVSQLSKLRGVKLKPPKQFGPTLPATFEPKTFTPLKPRNSTLP